MSFHLPVLPYEEKRRIAAGLLLSAPPAPVQYVYIPFAQAPQPYVHPGHMYAHPYNVPYGQMPAGVQGHPGVYAYPFNAPYVEYANVPADAPAAVNVAPQPPFAPQYVEADMPGPYAVPFPDAPPHGLYEPGHEGMFPVPQAHADDAHEGVPLAHADEGVPHAHDEEGDLFISALNGQVQDIQHELPLRSCVVEHGFDVANPAVDWGEVARVYSDNTEVMAIDAVQAEHRWVDLVERNLVVWSRSNTLGTKYVLDPVGVLHDLITQWEMGPKSGSSYDNEQGYDLGEWPIDALYNF